MNTEINESDLLEAIMDALLEQAEEMGIELDEEELAELSKATLGSYIKKAASDHGTSKRYEARGADDASRKASYASDRKRAIRGQGVMRAVGRLVKENVDQMIAAAHNNEPVAFRDAFTAAMTSMVADRIDEMRPQVAAKMFDGSKED